VEVVDRLPEMVLEFLFLGILEEVAGVEVIHGKSYRD
jgi:hypothetical protein